MGRVLRRPLSFGKGGPDARRRVGGDTARLAQLRDEAATRAEEARARRDAVRWRECEQIRRNLNYLIAKNRCEELTGKPLPEGLWRAERPEVCERLLHSVKHGLYREVRLDCHLLTGGRD